MIPIFFESRGRGTRELTCGRSARLRLTRHSRLVGSHHAPDFIATQSANSAVPRNFPRRIGCGCSKTEAALRLIFVNMPPLGYPPRPQPQKSERYLSRRIEEIRLQSRRYLPHRAQRNHNFQMTHTNHPLFQVGPLTAPWEEIGWKAVKTAFIE